MSPIKLNISMILRASLFDNGSLLPSSSTWVVLITKLGLQMTPKSSLCSLMDLFLCHIFKLNINEFGIISQTYISCIHYGQLRAHHQSVIKNILGFILYFELLGFPGGSDGKEFTCNAEHLCLIPGLG